MSGRHDCDVSHPVRDRGRLADSAARHEQQAPEQQCHDAAQQITSALANDRSQYQNDDEANHVRKRRDTLADTGAKSVAVRLLAVSVVRLAPD